MPSSAGATLLRRCRINAMTCSPSHAGWMRIRNNLDRSRKFPRNQHDACSKRYRVMSATRGAGPRKQPCENSSRPVPCGSVCGCCAAKETVRASSLVENLNSRLRSYFFLRRHLGPDYLALLQFFLNHRRLERSDRPERVGKTPAELLSGQSHPHWLEMLGYHRFSRG